MYVNVRGITRSASTRHWKVMGSMLGLDTRSSASMFGSNRVMIKDVKSCCYYFRCGTLIVRGEWECLSARYHAQLGLPDKSRAIKELVTCYVVWLGSIEWLFGPAQGTWAWSLFVVKMAIVP